MKLLTRPGSVKKEEFQMRNKKIIIPLIVIAAGVILFLVFGTGKKQVKEEAISPERGDMKSVISVTGIIEPMNRLEIKPPVSGRMEKILVKEGDGVKEGQVLAYLSSTERAALLDMAKSKGEAELKKWKDLYKPIPVSAPIDGTVIVRSVEPGQSVGSSDAILVLSDRLVVNAQADETDIGKVKKGQRAEITIDAYPAGKIAGRVEHISYESTTSSNVTVYEVLVLPEKVPGFFRSGMSATVEIIEKESKNALMVPSSAVKSGARGKFVVVMKDGSPGPARVETGISESGYTEIISGISAEDSIVTQSFEFKKAKKDETSNPLMPQRRKRR